MRRLWEIAETLHQIAAQITALASSAAADAAIGCELSLLDVARRILRERELIYGHLPGELFSDPARDLLLDLFIARVTGARISASSACIAAHAPSTTALRYLARLTEEGLLNREADEHDGRRVLVSLSDRGWEAMVAYLEAARGVWTAGPQKPGGAVG